MGYCGLTIVLSHPSRFDKFALLSAQAGNIFNNDCLRPEFNSMQCDIRVADDPSELLPNTKCILLLGTYAMGKYLRNEVYGNTLSEMRGTLFQYKGITAIPSYYPQDALDIKNYEQDNPLSHHEISNDIEAWEEDDGDEEKEGDVKRYGFTKRSNYLFWLRRDVWKAKQVLNNTVPRIERPIYRMYPPADEVIKVLTETKNEYLYLDIETDFEEQNIQCFSFCFNSNIIWNVPVLDWHYLRAYTTLHLILRALSIAMRDNIVVTHNGATFDLFVLCYKLHIPFRRAYDTMIAHQRCWPDIEKSLGHFNSYWNWEPFHKDENSLGYQTEKQMMDRMFYCGKDVFTMKLGKAEIDKYAKTIPGLQQSIDDANACIRPYLTSTLQGIKVAEEELKERIKLNDRLMYQYNRMVEILIGEQGMQMVRTFVKSKKPSFISGSNKQCVGYFHDLLGYPVQAYGKPDKFGKKAPALGKKQLYSLALKFNNPVITLICLYRQLRKETSRLQFTPYEQPK